MFADVELDQLRNHLTVLVGLFTLGGILMASFGAVGIVRGRLPVSREKTLAGPGALSISAICLVLGAVATMLGVLAVLGLYEVIGF